MVDVPNLSVLDNQREKMDVPLRQRLGRMIRDRRVQRGMSLRDTATKVSTALGEEFSTLVLGQIERGLRPVTAEQLSAFARILDLSQDALLQAASQWNEAVWETEPSLVCLEPDETRATTIHPLGAHELWDELCAVVADLDRGVEALNMATSVMDPSSVVAANSRLTAALLQASSKRIKGRMASGKVQVTCTPDQEIPSSTYPQL